jgi:LysM repeat protein
MAATYVVQQGDTLSGIAQKFGISLSDLESANPEITNPDLIIPGQVINIPGSESGDNGDGNGPKGKDDKDQKDKDKEGKEFKDKDKEGKEFKDKDKDHKDKDKDHKDKDHKDHKDKEHKDQKDHKDKEHKDHKEHPEKHDHEKHGHEKQHEGHGSGGSGETGAHAVSLGSGGTPLIHFIGAELRPDLAHTTLRREPDLAGGAQGMASQDGGAVAAAEAGN